MLNNYAVDDDELESVNGGVGADISNIILSSYGSCTTGYFYTSKASVRNADCKVVKAIVNGDGSVTAEGHNFSIDNNYFDVDDYSNNDSTDYPDSSSFKNAYPFTIRVISAFM